MGQALSEAIDRQGGKVAFSKEAGLSRATLYRLLAGENVSTEVLLRVLRALGRIDLLTELTRPPEPTPLERFAQSRARKKRPLPDPSTGPRAPFARLKLAGRGDTTDG